MTFASRVHWLQRYLAARRILKDNPRPAGKLECERIANEIVQAILELPDTDGKEILYRHYILGKPIKEIARSIPMCQRQVIRIHKRSVMALDIKE